MKKQYLSICFHTVRERVASGTLVPHKVHTDFNLADILTKALPTEKRKDLRSRIMYTDGEKIWTPRLIFIIAIQVPIVPWKLS